jgi:hypothetical protein
MATTQNDLPFRYRYFQPANNAQFIGSVLPSEIGKTGPTGAPGSASNTGATGPYMTITNGAIQRVLISNTGGTGAIGMSNLTMDDSDITLRVGPFVTPNLVPDGSISNVIICADNNHAELNTTTFGANWESSVVQLHARGSLSGPQPVQQDDLLGQYFTRGFCTGAAGATQFTGAFYNTSFINMRADYVGAAPNYVGGRILFRTKGNTTDTYGKIRLDITNAGLVRFYNDSNLIAYTMPQTGPIENAVLCSTGSAGNLYWKGPNNTLQARMTGALNVASGTNLLTPFDFVEINTINGLTYDLGTRRFTNTSTATRKYMFNMQVAMTGASASQADIWFSINGTFDTLNRFGQVASYTQQTMLSTSWLFTLAPSEFIYCYAWFQSNYTIGGAVNGNDAGYSTKVRVTELN